MENTQAVTCKRLQAKRDYDKKLGITLIVFFKNDPDKDIQAYKSGILGILWQEDWISQHSKFN